MDGSSDKVKTWMREISYSFSLHSRVTPEEYGVMTQLAAVVRVVQDPVLCVDQAGTTGCVYINMKKEAAGLDKIDRHRHT